MLGAWSEALHTAATVVDDRRVHSLLDDPHVTPEQLSKLVLDIAGAGLGEHGRNFVQILAEAGRLDCLPQIAALFDAYKDNAEGIADVTVTSGRTAGLPAAAVAQCGTGPAPQARGAPALHHRSGAARRRRAALGRPWSLMARCADAWNASPTNWSRDDRPLIRNSQGTLKHGHQGN